MSKCKHENIHYFPSINEDGWTCLDCGKRFGFSPKLDREMLYVKVWSILRELDCNKLITVSNGTEGEITIEMVMKICQEENLYDQYSIIKFIIDIYWKGHAKYWQEKAQE